MSSLKQQTEPRYRSRSRSALPIAKSSNWIIARGQRSRTPRTNASTSAS
jgi:hypothetical protein